MTTNTTMNPLDYLKFVAAEARAIVEQVQNQLGGLDTDQATADAIERANARLDALRDIVATAATFCRDGRDMDTYSDGRPVCTRLDIEEGNYYVHNWHPDHGHRINQPQEIGTMTTTSGRRRRLFSTAPGVLDAVDTLHVVPDSDGVQ